MNIFVIENNPNRHQQLVLHLGRLFRDARVRPLHTKPCCNWKQAKKMVEESPDNPADGDLIFIIDLALEGDDPNDARTGIENVKRIKLLRPKAILIAATSHASQLSREVGAENLFDAILDKQHSKWKIDEHLGTLLRETIQQILDKRQSKVSIARPIIQYQDSLGVRLAEAVVGRELLNELIHESTRGWDEVKAEALSAGFSGSHLLKLTGIKNGQQAGLVLKIATKREVLQKEAEAPKRYAESLDMFAGCINGPLEEVKQLGEESIFYLIQASIPGQTLCHIFEEGSKAEAEKALKPLLDLLIQQYKNAARKATTAQRTTEDFFSFRPDHPHRINNSCDALEAMGKILLKSNGWPTAVKSPQIIFQSIRLMTSNWLPNLSKIKVPFWVLQHGDLHAGNVLVCKGQLRFIDFARMEPCPVGYDVSRLATQARIFLTHHKSHEDWVQNHLHLWIKEDFAGFNSSIPQSLCPWAVRCDEAYHEFIKSCASSDRESLHQIYRLAALSDLLRILSYQNISSFKRIWAAIACWRLGQRLGFTR